MTLSAPKKKVALLIETSNGYARGLLHGVVAAAHRQSNWSVYLPEQERGAPPPTWLSSWKGDGIIARIENAEIAAAVRKTGLPVVDLSAAQLNPECPWVETNDKMIADLAAKHLRDRGFSSFGFCGDSSFNWSNWRLKEFQRSIRTNELHVYDALPKNHPRYSWNCEQERLAAWLKSLPKPIGILAAYDILARQVLDMCHELDIAVPEQIAVMGVDNDALICELCDPPLTSIANNPYRAGFLAAEILERMMNGEVVSNKGILVDPLGIEERQSTDVVAVEDPDIAKALRFIRENATANIRVADVVAHVEISRRKMETKFLQIVGRSPHQEIQLRRIAKVKQLLRQSNLSVAEIAHRTGYEHAEYLCVAFQRETGQTTSEYRESSQAEWSSPI